LQTLVYVPVRVLHAYGSLVRLDQSPMTHSRLPPPTFYKNRMTPSHSNYTCHALNGHDWSTPCRYLKRNYWRLQS